MIIIFSFFISKFCYIFEKLRGINDCTIKNVQNKCIISKQVSINAIKKEGNMNISFYKTVKFSPYAA